MQNLRVEAVVESFSRVSGLPDIDPVPLRRQKRAKSSDEKV